MSTLLPGTPASPVLTNLEAAAWLRLTDDYDQPEDAIEALYRIVRKGKLRPLRAGKTYKFTLDELRRYIAAEVVASKKETEHNGS